MSTKKPVILHLSDIHRTPDEPVTNAEILNPLKADIDSWEKDKVPKPDILLVTGDLSQSAEKSEYDEAEEFLLELLDPCPQWLRLF